jgi:hypothetical protein
MLKGPVEANGPWIYIVCSRYTYGTLSFFIMNYIVIQLVIQSLGSRQAVVRQSSGSRQAVVRQSSGSRQDRDQRYLPIRHLRVHTRMVPYICKYFDGPASLYVFTTSL